jgi:alkanesulfonate monooxygenase SsuD/methylene tetrahydromethanopterin reductase-like flavin-dependent oxidoreductase (luciferase family)
MKAALFNPMHYGPSGGRPGQWPMPPKYFDEQRSQNVLCEGLEQFELADQVGFDWVTVAEHHYSPFSLTPTPLVMAAAVGERVKRAKIAVLGPNVPIQNPVRVAEEFALLDNLTGGRAVAGLMRGTPNEYATYSTNPGESRDRFEEGFALIKRAWTEPQPFGWEGRYYQYRTVSVWPRPIQQPHPPVYMSASSRESGTFAARERLGIGLAVTNIPLAREAARHYRAEAERFGWQPSPEHVVYRAMAYVVDTDAQADADAEQYFGASRGPTSASGLTASNKGLDDAVASAGFYGSNQDIRHARHAAHTLAERIELGQIFLGSPTTVVNQLRKLHEEVGAGVVDLVFNAPVLPRDKAMRSVELFGKYVLPCIREF